MFGIRKLCREESKTFFLQAIDDDDINLICQIEITVMKLAVVRLIRH